MDNAKLTDELRAAVNADTRSISELARQSGLAQPTLYRFAHGQRELTSARLGQLLDVLGLEIRAKKPMKISKKRISK